MVDPLISGFAVRGGSLSSAVIRGAPIVRSCSGMARISPGQHGVVGPRSPPFRPRTSPTGQASVGKSGGQATGANLRTQSGVTTLGSKCSVCILWVGDSLMCGIAGVVGHGVNTRLEQTVRAMARTLEHRGPDAEGLVSVDDVIFAHRRLAILDLQSRSEQPMRRGPLTITYNGEIYNYIELRTELERLGHAFQTTGDTEVLLASYAQWGERCVEHLDGMWAFAIHDQLNQEVLLSRDRFGEKPLFYGWRDGAFFFASEARALRAVGLGVNANRDVVRQFLSFGGQLAPDVSFYEGISALRPATNMRLNARNLSYSFRNFYEPGRTGMYRDIEPGQVVEAFEHEFRHAIRTRLRSDVPVGMLLSGGIDSSLVAAFASPAYLDAAARPLVAITASSGVLSNDESLYAKKVADSVGLEWHCVQVDAGRTREGMMEATSAQDRPLPGTSNVLQMKVMRAAREQGVKVLLDGQGADESWLGYDRYIPAIVRELPLAEWPAAMRKAHDRSGRGLPYFVALNAYFLLPAVAAVRNYRRIRKVGIPGSYARTHSTMANDLTSLRAENLRQLRVGELQGMALGTLLDSEDRNSMAFSLESRLPYLGLGLIELAMATPPQVLAHDGWRKWPLRSLLSGHVPDSVAWRKGKIGFEADPHAFRPHEPSVLREIRESEILREILKGDPLARNVHPVLMWRFYALSLWERVCQVEASDA